jgi:hypothetical protein
MKPEETEDQYERLARETVKIYRQSMNMRFE